MVSGQGAPGQAVPALAGAAAASPTALVQNQGAQAALPTLGTPGLRLNALVAETGRMDSAMPAPAAQPETESSAIDNNSGGNGGRPAAPRRTAGGVPLALAALSPAASQARAQARQSALLPDGGPAPGTLAAAAGAAGPAGALHTGAGLLAALRSALQMPHPGASAPRSGPDAGGETAGAAAAGGAQEGSGRGQPVGAQGAADPRTPGQGAGGAAGGDLQGAAALPEGLSTADGSGAAPLPEGGLPDALAEQLAYWAADRLQGAELTLAHEGAPLQVRVLLEGDNAQVDFRSDQSDTRALLDAGTGQLRELLDQEGLVLSDVSVGSGAQPGGQPTRDPGAGAGSQADRARARPDRVQGAVAGPAPGEAVAHTRTPGERRLDVFA